MDVAIIGAGMAGLAAARRLRETRPDLSVVAFNKVAPVGGRAMSRQVHNAIVDHGAQYLKTPTPELRRYITETLGHANPVDIGRDVWGFTADGTIMPGDPEQNVGDKWTYAEGLGRLCEVMAEGNDVRCDVLIDRLAAHPDGGYELWSQDTLIGHANGVLLTPPAPLTVSLVSASALPAERRRAIVQELSRVVYRPCISVALGYAKIPATPPYYALVNTDKGHPISWVGYEHLKPGRPTANHGVLLVQMAPDWSATNHMQPHKQIAGDAAQLVAALLGKEFARPEWSDCFCWRYSLPNTGCDVSAIETDGLFFAGDYVAGQGRLHLAIESGWAAADRIHAWSTSVPA